MMVELDETALQEDNSNAEQAAEPTSAGERTPEDTQGRTSAWQSIAEDQRQTIDALTDHIKALDAQIAKLVQGGAQINDGRQAASNAPASSVFMDAKPESSLPDDYVPLRDLGKLIGKKD